MHVTGGQPTIQATLLPEGTPCRTCTLDDPNAAWWVHKGHVDIFATRLEEGRPTGNRTHLFRVEQGGMVFGIGCNHTEDGHPATLVAVGTADSELLPVDRGLFRAKSYEATHAAEVSHLVEAWVHGLSQGMSLGVAPKDAQEVEVGREIEVPTETCVTAKRGLSWVCHREGHSRLMGQEALPRVNGTGYFPLSRATWMETEGPARLVSMTTHDVLADEALWEGLDLIHGVVLDCVQARRQRQRALDQQRLQQKAQADQEAMDAAYAHLANVLSDSGVAAAPPAAPQNALLAACR